MKLNKTIIISDILSILIAFTLFIWIFIEMKCVAIVYDRILNNIFKKDFTPVQRISLGRNRCQEDNMTSLINYIFPGIKGNCYDNSTGLFLGEDKTCQKGNENLINIEEVRQTNITIWRNKMLCARNFDYKQPIYKFMEYEEGKDCEEGYKSCGHINRDVENEKMHKILCLKKEEDCPLNFISIEKDISKYLGQPGKYNISSLDNNYYLITSNNHSDNEIITQIVVSEGIYPCIEKGKYSNSTPQFPTIINSNNFNCKPTKIDDKKTNHAKNDLRTLDEELIEEGYDIRYIKFDNLTKNIVFTDNDLNYAYNKLPNVSNWKQDMNSSYFNLFYLTKFMVKDACKNFDKLQNNIDSLKTIQAYRVVFALFHIIIYVILFSVLGLIKVILAWRHSMLFGIKVGLSFIIFVINYVFIYYSENYVENLGEFDSLKECLDEVSIKILTNHDIKSILDELNEFYKFEKIVWYIYIFFNFIEACRLVHKIYIRCKNTYRRNIANREIGAENLKLIFEKVRNELEKNKNKKN